MPIIHKTCSSCNKKLPVNQFHKDKTHSDGLKNSCKACRSIYSREYHAKNSEPIREKARQWWLDNPERHKENTDRWKRNNPEKLKKSQREWDKRNADRNARYQRQYYKDNPEQVAKNNHARRTRVLGAPGKYSASEWVALCEKYENKCLCCGRSDVALTVDHVVPLVKGGSNYISNIQPLCGPCNSRKGAKVIDFRERDHGK